MKLSRAIIYSVLVTAAFATLALALFTDEGFTNTVATNAFWMILGVVFTTVILQTLLQRVDLERTRKRDLRYLRTMTSRLMTILATIAVTTDPRPETSPFRAVLEDDATFEEIMHRWSKYVQSSQDVNSDEYARYYADVQASLREIAVSGIRLVSKDHRDMVDNYELLQSLAARWSYRYELSGGESRALRDAAAMDSLALLSQTSELVVRLLRNSKGKTMVGDA